MRCLISGLAFGLSIGWPAASIAMEPPEASLATLMRLQEKQGLSAGLVVMDPVDRKVLYSWRGDEAFVPASNMKLLTTAAALDRLGPHFTYKTRLLAVAPLREGVLEGDLYLEASGDPGLVEERLGIWVQEVLRTGLRKVIGDLVVDTSVFDDQGTVETWKIQGPPEAYEAPVGALSLNYNVVEATVRPNRGPGRPHVLLNPATEYFDIVNEARDSDKTNSLNLSMGVEADGRERIHLSGKIPARSEGVTVRRPVKYPVRFAATVFKERLEAAGVRISGGIREGLFPEEATSLAVFESPPLHELIALINKHSNNFMAEALVKTIGREATGTPGSTRAGLEEIRRYLADLGGEAAPNVLADGSGLSRANRIQPEGLARVLASAWSHFPYNAEYMASLAVWGADGTLRKAGHDHAYRVRAKTGYLDGVKSLSGYFSPAGEPGHPLVFSLIVNDPKKRYGAMKRTVQTVMNALIETSWDRAAAESSSIPEQPGGSTSDR